MTGKINNDILNDPNESKPEWFNKLHSKLSMVPVHRYKELPLSMLEQRSIVEILDSIISDVPVIGKRIKDMNDNLRPDGYTYRADMTQQELDEFEAFFDVKFSRGSPRYLTARYCIWRIRQVDEKLAEEYYERLSAEYEKAWDLIRGKPKSS